MRILAVADQPSEYLWGPGVTQGLEGIDLILSCGDLDPLYLSFLATFTNAPVLYVHGNHDGSYSQTPPEGCVCVEDKLYLWQGLRILGLGGSIRYNGESSHQYTQGQMRRRVWRQQLALRRAGGVDIVLTHAPALGLGDGTDRAHVGFEAFNELIDRWQPALLIHGHTHLTYSTGRERVRQRGETKIVNAYERYVLDFEPGK